MECSSPHDPPEPLFTSEHERQLWQLCKSCWIANPADRPSLVQLKKGLQLLQSTFDLSRQRLPNSPMEASHMQEMIKIEPMDSERSKDRSSQSMPGKVLLDNIVAKLPPYFNLTSILQVASKESEPRASGGNCDVTFGMIPWATVELNRQILSRCAHDGKSKFLPIAIKRARAHALNSLSIHKRELFITVRCLRYGCQ